MSDREVELLAVGAGPSNLALAVALEELAPGLAENSLMIEREAAIEWQPGLLLPWAKSQVAFLKDLVTLRNPQSEFSFLNYLYSVGRLDDFINMASFEPYRAEISEYFQWAASSLSKVQLRLNCACTSLEPRRAANGTLTGWLAELADGTVVGSRYLVIGIGRDPFVPTVFAGVPASRLVHSTRYQPVVAGLDKDFPYRVAVVGSAQSAAEMYRALQDDLPNAQINWVMRSIGIGAYEKTKFTNELYFPSTVDDFFAAKPAAREQLLQEMHKTNYSGIEPPFVESLYCEHYLDRLSKQDRKRIITMTDITAADATENEITLELTYRMTESVSELHTDLVFLGTGFVREMPALIRRLGDALNLFHIQANRQYRLILNEPADAACYLQGVNEATHGIGDSLLSVIACRAGEIVHDILDHRAALWDGRQISTGDGLGSPSPITASGDLLS
ncbi:MAG TPA: SidA/IucD/PvdA family monooxygenase [Streptosporangiaceae bacterium]|jgi:L-ornithine N5-oxygenase